MIRINKFMLEGNSSQRSKHHYWKTLEGKSSNSKRKIPHKIREEKLRKKNSEKYLSPSLISPLLFPLVSVYVCS